MKQMLLSELIERLKSFPNASGRTVEIAGIEEDPTAYAVVGADEFMPTDKNIAPIVIEPGELMRG